eukprot:1502924-Pleurochrysis_carterae.AAC.5
MHTACGVACRHDRASRAGGRRGTGHVPFVETASTDKRQTTANSIFVRGELHGAGASEATVNASGCPELPNREKRVIHRRHATHARQRQVYQVTLVASGRQMHVTYGHASLGRTINSTNRGATRHRVV